MTKQELLSELKNHDWYFDYSEDHSVWQRGLASQKKLRHALEVLGCEFGWWDIYKAIFGFVVEDFEEVREGVFRKPKWSDVVASCTRKDLITKEQADEILKWFEA